MMKKYTIVYKDPDSLSFDDEIKFYEYLGPYQLWVKLSTIEHQFDYHTAGDEIFFVEYDGYIGIVLTLID